MNEFSINVPITIDFYDVADNLLHSQALEFAKLIDERQQSYEFTEELAFYLLEEAVKCLGGGTELIDFKQAVQTLLSKY